MCLATINTILDTMPEQLDVASFIEPLKVGLADQQDVQVLCHQILIKILSNQLLLVKGGILSHVEGLMVPLKVCLMCHSGKNSKKGSTSKMLSWTFLPLSFILGTHR